MASWENEMEYAIKEGNIDYAKVLFGLGTPEDWNGCVISAKYGCFDFLDFCYTEGQPITLNVIERALHYPDCLSYAIEYVDKISRHDQDTLMNACAQRGLIESIQVMIDAGWQISNLMCHYAAEAGDWDTLEFVFQLGAPLDVTIPCTKGQMTLSVIEYILNSDQPLRHRIKCMAFAIDNGCELREEFCEDAVQSNSYILLKYLRENPFRQCPWNLSVLRKINHTLEIEQYFNKCQPNFPKKNIARKKLYAGSGAVCGEYGYECGKVGCLGCLPEVSEESDIESEH